MSMNSDAYHNKAIHNRFIDSLLIFMSLLIIKKRMYEKKINFVNSKKDEDDTGTHVRFLMIHEY